MRKLLIALLLILFVLIVLWGVQTAAAGTHAVLGDTGYRPFISF